MTKTILARLYFALTLAAVVVGIAITLYLAPGDDDSHFGTPQGRVINVFMFFTTQANLLVGVACLLLVLRPDRRSTAFAAVWLTGLVGIIVTGAVYHTMLAHLYDRTGIDVLGNFLRHTVVPIAAPLGWLLFGPRGVFTRRAVLWTLAFPAAFTALTLVRGLLVDWYPYPFIDVIDIGYGTALRNGVAIIGGYVLLAAALRLADTGISRAVTRRPRVKSTAPE